MPGRSSNRKEEIFEVAIELFYEQGYAGTSMRDVAERVGLLKGSLYHHFESKEDLVVRIFDQATEETVAILARIEATEAPPAAKLREFVNAWSLWYLRNLEMVSVYLAEWKHLDGERERRVVQTRREVYERVHGLIEAAAAAGEAPAALDSRYAAFFVLSVINGLPTWYRRGGPDDPEAVAAAYADLVAAMLASADGTHGGAAPSLGEQPEPPLADEEPADGRAEELLAAAVAAFHEEGFDRTNMQDIADRTSVIRGSIYHHIESKEGLLAEIFERATEESFALLGPIEAAELPSAERLDLFVGVWCLYYLENLEVVSVYVDEWKHLDGERREAALATRRRAYDVVAGYVEAVRAAAGAAPDPLIVRYSAMLILSAINGLTGWYKRGQPDPPEQIAAAYGEMATALVVGHTASPNQAFVR